MGSSGTASFTQTGGTNSADYLYLGGGAGGSGSYSLSGSGHVLATGEYLAFTASATAAFQQTGGTNTTSLLSIGNGGRYLLAGGLLQVNGSLVNQGTFSGGGTSAALSANNILDLTSGTWQNLGEVSLSMGSNSLLIVPSGFSPASSFAAYGSLGLTHTAGTTLTVPAGKGFAARYRSAIRSFARVRLLPLLEETINLNAGLVLSGTGLVQLGSGTLTNNDLVSGISGGGLSVAYQYVGSGGTGSFTQSAGSNTISNNLYAWLWRQRQRYVQPLWQRTGVVGIYAVRWVFGAGSFTQSGGTNGVEQLSLSRQQRRR